MKWFAILRIASSLKTEVKIVLAALGVLLLLPSFAVVVVAQSGIELVSNALAWLNPVTHKVEVRDPNGNIITQLDATTAWPTNGVITQEFGVPNPPYEASHSGIDIAGSLGDPVTTFMSGKVTQAGHLSIACGSCVYVNHGNNITSSYSHLSAIKVKAGDEVKPGDIIGSQGQEGWASGVHLHFSIRVYDVLVNPRIFMVGEPPLRTAQ